MKFCIILFFLLSVSSFAQVKLEKSVAQKMQANAKELINSYIEKLNKIGSKSIEGNKKMVLIQEAFQLFDNKDVRVFNNIDATGKKSSDPKISTYLEDIYVLYNKDGITFNFENISLSDIFISRNFDYFFYKVTLESVTIGKSNNGEKLDSRITQDLFIQYKLKGQVISPEPVIYEIFKSPVATDGFVKPQIVDDGSNPQPFIFGKKWENIEISSADKLKEDAKKWVANYYTSLNTLGSKQYDMMKKSLLTQEIIEQFENDGIIVYYDIDPEMGIKPSNPDIATYLGDIVTLYGKEGISFQHKEPVNSELFISKNNKFLFLISSVDRTVNGKDNSGKQINYTLKLNFIIQYNISDSIVKRRPVITTITDQDMTSQNFIKINLTGTPSAKNKLVLEPGDDEVKAILDKTKEKEEENKKMAEDYNQKIKEQQKQKELAEQEKIIQEHEKKLLLWQQNNINKYWDGWDKKLMIKYYPLRMIMGSVQLSVEQGLKTTGKVISVEQTLGLYPGIKPLLFSYDEMDNPVWVSKTGDKNSTFFGYTLRTEFRFYLKPNTMYGKYFSVQFFMDKMTWSSLEPYRQVFNSEGTPELTHNGVTYNYIEITADKYDAARTHIGGVITYGGQRKIYRSKYVFEVYVGIGIRQQTITRNFTVINVTGVKVITNPDNIWDYHNEYYPLTDYPYTYSQNGASGNSVNVRKSVKYYPDIRLACKFGYRFGKKKLD